MSNREQYPRISLELTGEQVDQGQKLELPERESHYLQNVLRLKTGEKLILSCQRNSWLCTLIESSQIKIESPWQTTESLSFVKTLAFATCKGDKNELVIQKATELGVQSILLWQSQNSVAKIPSEKIAKKLARWKSIAQAACAQSKRNNCPQIEISSNLAQTLDIIKQKNSEQKIFFASTAINSKLLKNLDLRPSQMHLLIGPEGDFSSQEIDELQHAGAMPFSLGPQILRSETAAIAAVSAINALLGFRTL